MGIWNVEQDHNGLLYQITADQLALWAVYYSIHPFGEERADWRCAQTTAAIYNVNIDTKKHGAVKVSDFMLKPNTPQPSKEKTAEELRFEWEEHKAQMRSMGRARRKHAERLRGGH